MESKTQNLILSRIPIEEMRILAPRLRSCVMHDEECIANPGDVLLKIYFPRDAIFSVQAEGAKGNLIEVALIGREGCAGAFAALEQDSSPYRISLERAGGADAVDRDDLVGLLESLPALRRTLLRNVHLQLRALANAAALGASQSVIGRLALRLAERFALTPENILSITHDELSDILGVHRPCVTNGLHLLEERGAIRSARGRIRLVNDEALLTCAKLKAR